MRVRRRVGCVTLGFALEAGAVDEMSPEVEAPLPVVVVVSRPRNSGQVDDDGNRLSDLQQRQRTDIADCADHPCR